MVCALRVRRIQQVEIPDLPDRIREARERLGKSVMQASKDVGISRQAWHDIEAKKAETISYQTLMRIADLLSMDLSGCLENFEEVS